MQEGVNWWPLAVDIKQADDDDGAYTLFPPANNWTIVAKYVSK